MKSNIKKELREMCISDRMRVFELYIRGLITQEELTQRMAETYIEDDEEEI